MLKVTFEYDSSCPRDLVFEVKNAQPNQREENWSKNVMGPESFIYLPSSLIQQHTDRILQCKGIVSFFLQMRQFSVLCSEPRHYTKQKLKSLISWSFSVKAGGHQNSFLELLSHCTEILVKHSSSVNYVIVNNICKSNFIMEQVLK